MRLEIKTLSNAGMSTDAFLYSRHRVMVNTSARFHYSAAVLADHRSFWDIKIPLIGSYRRFGTSGPTASVTD